ncbi:MAG: DUF2095 family protein, partial [Candidatus Ranarchaeia archaeon]
MDDEKFFKKYPSLVEEIKKKKLVLKIEGVEKPEEVEKEEVEDIVEEYISRPYYNYSPNYVDFIRRCKTKEEALEILDFLEKKKEIDSKEAKKIRNQLEKEGIRSFGTLKKRN